MATSTTTASPAIAAGSSTQRATACAAMLLGAALLFLIGFAPLPAVHNAAHDTRHSAAFPCH